MISLIEIALKSSVVAGVALLLTQLKYLPAAQRALIAHLGLALTLLMPVQVLFGPEIGIVGPWSRALPAAIAIDAAPIADAIATPSAAMTPAAALPISALGVFAVSYGIVAMVLLLGLVAGLMQLGRLRRDAQIVVDGNWLGALARAQSRLGVRQGATLLVSERLASPVSWGLLRPTIMLNPAALRASDRAEVILSHELAHVVRMDWVNLLVSRITVAALWINPLIWLLAQRAHDLREQAADDIVLDGQVQSTDYATLLVDFARAGGQGAPAANGMAQGKTSLKRRLQRILDETVRRERAHPIWTTGCVAIALALAAPLGALTPIDQIAPAKALAAEMAKPAQSAQEPAQPTRAEQSRVREDIASPPVVQQAPTPPETPQTPAPLPPPLALAATRADLELAPQRDSARAEAQSRLNLEKVRMETEGVRLRAEQARLDMAQSTSGRQLPPNPAGDLSRINGDALLRSQANEARLRSEQARLTAEQARLDITRKYALLARPPLQLPPHTPPGLASGSVDTELVEALRDGATAEAQARLNLEKARVKAEQTQLQAERAQLNTTRNNILLRAPARLQLPPMSTAELNTDLAEAKSREASKKARLNAQARIDMAKDQALLAREAERLRMDTMAAARLQEREAAAAKPAP